MEIFQTEKYHVHRDRTGATYVGVAVALSSTGRKTAGGGAEVDELKLWTMGKKLDAAGVGCATAVDAAAMGRKSVGAAENSREVDAAASTPRKSVGGGAPAVVGTSVKI